MNPFTFHSAPAPLRNACLVAVSCIFLSQAAPLAAQGHSLWSKTLYFEGESGFSALAPTSDGGTVAAGFAPSERFKGSPETNSDALIAKIAPDGTVVWETLLGGSETDIAYAVAQTSDGGYLAGGFTRSGDGDFGRGGTRADSPWVAMLDSSGSLLWARILPGTGSGGAWVKALDAPEPGEAVAVGFGTALTGEGCSGSATVALWKIADQGRKATVLCTGISFTFPDAFPALAAAVLPGGEAAAAWPADGTIRVSRLSASGSESWSRDMGRGEVAALAPAAGGGVYGGGRAPDGRPRIFALGADGSLGWERAVSGVPQGAVSGMTSWTGGFFAAGTAEIPGRRGEGNFEMLALKGDSDGATLWSTTAGGRGVDTAQAAASIRDGTFLAAGSTSSWDGFLSNRRRGGRSRQGLDPWIVKFNP
ncbi:MAG: hypothetical protein LBT40_05670 [Deltaproteobacteria bacterium]|jgi:hypothetical protein|nr:hypothetical protein [Deltaproteobacteria bacterium]